MSAFFRRDEPISIGNKPTRQPPIQPMAAQLEVRAPSSRRSFGSESFDKVFWPEIFKQHPALYSICETQTTDYASSLLKSYSSVEIHNRRNASIGKPSLLVVGNDQWLHQLPNVEAAKSVAKPVEAPSGDMKIAWRYQMGTPKSVLDSQPRLQVDFKHSLSPAANLGQDYTLLPLRNFPALLQGIEESIKANPYLTTIVIPNFLHPAIYNPASCTPELLVPFLHCLKQKASASGIAVLLSLSLGPLVDSKILVWQLQMLSDTVIVLESFENDRYQGFLNTRKIAGVSERGMYPTEVQNKVFRLTRHGMEVEEWSIPSELETSTQENPPATPKAKISSAEGELY